jgi:hypothetical protein
MALSAVLFLGLLVAAAPLFDRNRTKPQLDAQDYQDNPASLAGNRYFVQGIIADRLARSEVGVVYAVTMDPGDSLAIIIPASVLPQFNIARGQRLYFDVRIADDGSVVATQIAKK